MLLSSAAPRLALSPPLLPSVPSTAPCATGEASRVLLGVCVCVCARMCRAGRARAGGYVCVHTGYLCACVRARLQVCVRMRDAHLCSRAAWVCACACACVEEGRERRVDRQKRVLTSSSWSGTSQAWAAFPSAAGRKTHPGFLPPPCLGPWQRGWATLGVARGSGDRPRPLLPRLLPLASCHLSSSSPLPAPLPACLPAPPSRGLPPAPELRCRVCLASVPLSFNPLVTHQGDQILCSQDPSRAAFSSLELWFVAS